MALLNRLNEFHFGLEHFQKRKNWKESVAEVIVVVEIMFSILMPLYSFFLHYSPKLTAKILLVSGFSHGVVFYFSAIIMLTEGRFLFGELALTKYFDYLNKRFCCYSCEKELEVIMQKHHILQELTKLFNKTFSLTILLLIGFYFVTLLVRVMSLYCSVFVNNRNLLGDVEIFGICINTLKLGWMIIISNDCTCAVSRSKFSNYITLYNLFSGKLSLESHLYFIIKH